MTDEPSFFLTSYFQRIGFKPSETLAHMQPSLALLNALTFAHATHIPFENIAILNQEPIALSPEALHTKLVLQQRGGYCFEQNGLFLEVLKRLGFKVLPLAGRVRLGSSDRNELTNRTHLLLQVELDGEFYITDVGVGSSSLTQALKLKAEEVQTTPHDIRRLQYERGQWYLQILYAESWQDVYQFSGELMPLPDREVANWYTSTSPKSYFTRDLTVAMAHADGSRSTIKNTTFTWRNALGEKKQKEFKNKTELKQQLKETFNLNIDV